ncbi:MULTISPECIES: hypothetical protein [Halobacteriovorax]|uniref:Uncharacterized protein n=1 Tax=Halobacteriovorax vibrionivorans TaxID=2152716 RepID=A0ABY0IMB5_9BACT|nr:MULTISPECIES: hypothetical protein [Halobacteriovorax]RZF22659.1 hypothetical protein DAY19_02485 [Halobacteriovorax vibrionivorans]TGD46680.1 hypothetical protein EP118_10870 [Halobacteriovorax sp. Y22]
MELLEITLVTVVMALATSGNIILSGLSYWEAEDNMQKHISHTQDDYGIREAELEEHTKVA